MAFTIGANAETNPCRYSPAICPIPGKPRLQSPEPSHVIASKDSSQGPNTLPRPPAAPSAPTSHSRLLATTLKTSNPASVPGTSKITSSTGLLVAPIPAALPTTLGKRKFPMEEQVPGIEIRRPARVELQLQYMDGTIVPTSSSTKKRRGLDDDDRAGSPSVRTITGEGEVAIKGKDGAQSNN